VKCTACGLPVGGTGYHRTAKGPHHFDCCAANYRALLVEADSALSLIYYRHGSILNEVGNENFKREVLDLIERLRSASK